MYTTGWIFSEYPEPVASGINIPDYFPINAQTYPLSNLNLSAVPQRVPGITLVNYAGIQPCTPWSNFESIYDIKDNMTWTRART